jgi:predicted alpha/beta superfamily hydrolase
MRAIILAATLVNLAAAATALGAEPALRPSVPPGPDLSPVAASGPLGAPPAAPRPSIPPEPFVLPNTQVHSMHSEETGADYQLFIATPGDYKTSGKKYPVVIMLDADYSFALTRNVVKHFVDRKKLPEMILVAIGYPGAADDMEVYKRTRKRDYTPALSPISTAAAASQDVERGGAVHFRNFIADEVIPYVATNFPISADRTFIGHSYGGLFGTYVLMTEPELFKRYIIVSPSLWYDNRMIFRVEQQTAAHRQLDRQVERHVFFAIGSQETRAETGAPMVDELKQFYKRLEARREPGAQFDLRVYPDETHDSVFPSAVTGGLLAVFPSPQS